MQRYRREWNERGFIYHKKYYGIEIDCRNEAITWEGNRNQKEKKSELTCAVKQRRMHRFWGRRGWRKGEAYPLQILPLRLPWCYPFSSLTKLRLSAYLEDLNSDNLMMIFQRAKEPFWSPKLTSIVNFIPNIFLGQFHPNVLNFGQFTLTNLFQSINDMLHYFFNIN